jgi:hypothetical protein
MPKIVVVIMVSQDPNIIFIMYNYFNSKFDEDKVVGKSMYATIHMSLNRI